ncbi:MAG: YjeE family ATPase [Candidatus Azambacteria bacterium GW2011_GWB2_46_37]|uniref:tRNA threonylcarbamoyladenosine biosynthesis protein TsaE n=5 Tax=Candidatus Azamiibacteriota TaxID=1752741 RepID=A0A0G1NQA0_9BACT|nr:MAG: YjeE family ATPase [Candidatus Azambacteria bacterium GW2011_GWC1_46_13]KKU37341.1 MAG: YjeE family ATPase [Candidatus Azambacteria bacterium GW2011_GWF2_46_32]KKU39582.1 MAG: YjeE family ATPase [Candidatus Azambacteria bacterium GW2011_GWB2_46_37]HAQ05447.1 tRNA (adenosine(37)-N6)-threonylcarbamoyltransferase complex ATPase subunit type 1 TsaE [Candidatus Azambacteria bacterium]HBC59162.1 tRNA (adenosine(37)-N6)-threonylcarbamoyltransferase complex ATPase subunit type 1 TsaE [Candidatu
MAKFITTNSKQTQKLAEMLAKEIKSAPLQKRAFVVGLEGDLGSGKTTFTQGFARGLKIKEKILSPTFVILKKFKIHKHKLNVKNGHKYFYHFDCYRLESSKDLTTMGFKEIIKNTENIVLIEWADKIKRALPKDYLKIKFRWLDKNKREIKFEA